MVLTVALALVVLGLAMVCGVLVAMWAAVAS